MLPTDLHRFFSLPLLHHPANILTMSDALTRSQTQTTTSSLSLFKRGDICAEQARKVWVKSWMERRVKCRLREMEGKVELMNL